MKTADKKEKFFDIHLYIEGLRQIRTMGMVFMVMILICAVIIPAVYVWNFIIEGGGLAAETVNLFEVFPFLLAVMYIFAPVMALRLFRFLNKRNESDFYHALSFTRPCLYVSFFAAVMTWAAAQVVISVLFEILILKLASKVIILNMASVWPFALAVLCGCFLMISAVLVAMSLTGTYFSNIALALLILFLPRLILMVMTNAVASTCAVIVQGRAFGLLEASYNVPAGIVINCINYFSGGTSLNNILTPIITYAPSAYTFILGCVYFALGMLLFAKRRSETAQNPAANKYLQAALRIAAAMVPCIFGCMILYKNMFGSYAFSGLLIFGFFACGIAVYFLFEIISAKKVRNLLKIFPGLLILAAVCVIIIFGMRTMYKSQIAFAPEADEIESVSVTVSYSTSAYFTARQSEVKLTDKRAGEIVSEGLKTALEYDGAGTSGYSTELSEYTVIIRTGNTEKYRNIYLTDEEYEELVSCFDTSDDMKELYTQLPDSGRITSIYLNNIDIYSSYSLTEDQMIGLYECAAAEFAEMEFTDAYNIITNYYYTDEDGYTAYYLDILAAQITDGTDVYYVNIPIVPAAMPQTCALYAEYVNECNEDALTLAAEYARAYTYGEIDDEAEGMVIYYHTEDGTTSVVVEHELYFESSYLKDFGIIYGYISSEEKAQVFYDFISSYEAVGDEYISLYYNEWVSEDGEETYIGYMYILNVDSSALPAEFKEMFLE